MTVLKGELAHTRVVAALPTRSTQRNLGVSVVALVLAGCGSIGPVATDLQTFVPAPPLSVVAIIDLSPGQVAVECQELASVVQAGVTPSETLVVSPLSDAPLARAYTVRKGDSLNSIAGDQGVSLAALEAANPHLGPVAGRDWNRIYPADRVTIPGRGSTDLPGNLVVTRAPRGPAPPTLVPLPQRPDNATSFQEAQYRRAFAGAMSANRGRVTVWKAQVATELHPWQARVTAQLEGVVSLPEVATLPESAGSADLFASIEAAATTLEGLAGRRVLLVLDAPEGGPPTTAMGNGSLSGVHLVVANLSDVTAAAAWRSWSRPAGASVTTLDQALTQLQLASAVNS